MDTKSDGSTIKKAFPCRGCLVVSICEEECESCKRIKLNGGYIGRLALNKGICAYCGEWIDIEDRKWSGSFHIKCDTCRHTININRSSVEKGYYKIKIQGVKSDKKIQDRFLGLFKKAIKQKTK